MNDEREMTAMKILDIKPTRNSALRHRRRDSPDKPLTYVNLGLPENIWQQLDKSAKTNCRTPAGEVRFRLMRDLDKNP
jgi:hypothetical protein